MSDNPFQPPVSREGGSGTPADYISAPWKIFVWTYGIGLPLSFILIGLPVLIVAFIYGCILLYRYWDILQKHRVSVSPGRALGYCFIPFFNFYWFFVAYVNLADYYNNFVVNQIKNPAERVSRGLAISYCVLSIVTCLPYVGIIAAIPALIVYFLLMRELRLIAEKILVYNRSESVQDEMSSTV